FRSRSPAYQAFSSCFALSGSPFFYLCFALSGSPFGQTALKAVNEIIHFLISYMSDMTDSENTVLYLSQPAGNLNSEITFQPPAQARDIEAGRRNYTRDSISRFQGVNLHPRSSYEITDPVRHFGTPGKDLIHTLGVDEVQGTIQFKQ